jgi:hypothetical protein
VNRFISTCLFCLILFAGCASGNASPVANNPRITAPQAVQPSDHMLFGAWDIVLNLQDKTAEVIENRDALQHYNITKYLTPPSCKTCLTVKVISTRQSRILSRV